MRNHTAMALLIGATMTIGSFSGCATPDSGPLVDRSASPNDPYVTTAPAPTTAAFVDAFPHIRVRPGGRVVEVAGEASLDDGWLEQIACGRRSREHESLVVVDARPSDLHAALLLAGFESGAPGYWTYENETYRFQPPRGDALRISARYTGADGRSVTVPIRAWIRDHARRAEFPDEPWIFAGSGLEPLSEDPAAGERYIADDSGSVIGLVTFGDEVIGFSQVIADATEVQAPEWVVNRDAVPAPGTPVTLVIERR